MSEENEPTFSKNRKSTGSEHFSAASRYPSSSMVNL